jgi:hypothetical protein
MGWKSGTGSVVLIGGVLWVAWCFLVVTAVMPALLRKLTVWPGTTAYVLCLLPLVGGAAWLISAATKDLE